jgi:hypothetical protein
VARSSPGVVSEISAARRSFDPGFPAGPAARKSETVARPGLAVRRRPVDKLVTRLSGDIIP